MREIVLDTETTGLDANNGDRIVEIGCVELNNHIATGEVYHVYINPARDVPQEAARIHGLTTEFLKDKPIFAEIMDAFLAFIGDDTPLVIHNATFDMAFLNAELKRHGMKQLPLHRAIDTLPMARKKYPGSPASLDALCKRFSVDSTARTFHGALLDAQLLAEVYLELCGGRQPGFTQAGFTEGAPDDRQAGDAPEAQRDRVFHEARLFAATPEELAAHEAFLEKIKNPIWREGDKA